MKTRPMDDDLRRILEDNECLLADGFDNCVVTHTVGDVRAVYSSRLVMEQLILEGMSMEDAMEHFYYNILGGVPGNDQAPVFINDYYELNPSIDPST